MIESDSDLAVLPVMLSSKLLPEMETDDNVKREQLLQGVQNLPIPMQIERLKVSCMQFFDGFLREDNCILLLLLTGEDRHDFSSL